MDIKIKFISLLLIIISSQTALGNPQERRNLQQAARARSTCTAEWENLTDQEIVNRCFINYKEVAKSVDSKPASSDSEKNQVAEPQCIVNDSRTCCTNPLNGCMDSDTLEGALSAGDESLGTVQAVLDQMGGTPGNYAKEKGMAEICFGIAAITGAASALSTTAKTNCTNAIGNCRNGCNNNITEECKSIINAYEAWYDQCKKYALEVDDNKHCTDCGTKIMPKNKGAPNKSYCDESCPPATCQKKIYSKNCKAFDSQIKNNLQDAIHKIRNLEITKCECNNYSSELPKMENNIRESAKSADQAGQCANGLLDGNAEPCPNGLPRLAGICPPSPNGKDEPCPDGSPKVNGECKGTTPDDPCPGVQKINGLCPPPKRECKPGETKNTFGICVPKHIEEKDCPVGQIKDASGQCVNDISTEETNTNSKKIAMPGRSFNGNEWAGSEHEDSKPLLNSGGGFRLGSFKFSDPEAKEEEKKADYYSQNGGGGGFGGYKAAGDSGIGFFGSSGNRKPANLENKKGKAIVKRSENLGGGGKYDSIFERISKRFKKLCITKMKCN